MRRFYQITIMAVFAFLLALTTASCNKKVKKIKVDNHFAVSIFNDTISLRQILNDMDSTSNKWLRVRNDSVFVFYSDSVNFVLNANDLLGKLGDVSFNTSTRFDMPDFMAVDSEDTVIIVDRFMTVPFRYDDFAIEEVILRSGNLSFNFDTEPNIAPLKRLELYSYQMLTTEGDTLYLTIDLNKPGFDIDLADYTILPENDTLAFGARVYLHVDSGIYEGGEHECSLSGSMSNVGFKTVYAIVEKQLDSIFSTDTEIDFGIDNLSGQALLPIPKISLTYRNTFGLSALCDVNVLKLTNENTGLVTNLLTSDHVDVDILPTDGAYNSFVIDGLADQIDAMAGYTRLNFEGGVTMAMPHQHISISDTSAVNVVADIEMPLSFTINNLQYYDTFSVDFGDDVNVDDYFDEIDFFIDFYNLIPLEVNMQALFLDEYGTVLDQLFEEGASINYNESSTIMCRITGDKLDNVMRAEKMALGLSVNTPASSPGPVIIKESQTIAVRMRILTKTSEINVE